MFSFQKLKDICFAKCEYFHGVYSDAAIKMCECSASVTSLVVLSPIYLSLLINQCEKKLQIITLSFDLIGTSLI